MHKAFAKQLLKCFGLKQYFITSCQVSRLMPTCSLFKWILEEKDFKVCQLTAVDMNLSPQEEVMPQSAVAISTIVVGNVIWWMVMIAAIGLGATHLSRCPVQPNVPIFLIVLGAASLLSLSLTYTRSTWKVGAVSLISSACTAFLYFFSLCWFIAGTIWVYSVYPPSYTPGEARYCHKTTFQFAFTVTTLTWVLLTLVFVCGSCFAVLTCCKTVRARRYLIPRRNTDYGGTSDFEKPIAGDV